MDMAKRLDRTSVHFPAGDDKARLPRKAIVAAIHHLKTATNLATSHARLHSREPF
jgi:hypothetical protein